MNTIAKRLVANALVYAKERQREINRYRISWNMLAKMLDRTMVIRPLEIEALNDELNKLGWFVFQFGTEFCLMELSRVDSWVKLSDKRVIALTDEQVDLLLSEAKPVQPRETVASIED